jgi:hypothetical protein
MESLITKTGLPEEFGLTILLFSLVLLLAPWLSSADFGFLKIPAFPERTRRTLRILGPMVFFSAIAIHLPFFTVTAQQEDDSSETSPALDESSPTPQDAIRDADMRDLLVALRT